MSGTVYAQNWVTSVFVGQTGHNHTRADSTDGPMALDCPTCEPYLVKEGWVYDPKLVPLTEVQVSEQERIEREGNFAVQQVATALADAAADALSGKGSANRRTTGRTRAAPKTG